MRIQGFKKAISTVGYVFYIFIIVIAFDVLILNKLLGFGYPHHFEQENVFRYPAPYVSFTGKPFIADHNEFGFRGPSFKSAWPGDLKIAFFGGSSGYTGNPSIAKIIEEQLERRLNENMFNVNVFVANYSVISSNHRQHLHGIIEYLPPFNPDLVIFYGGYNETVQSALYDPRPGYPYNYFYRSETRTFFKLVLENSGIIGEIDRRLQILTGIDRLRKEQQPFSDDWNESISKKYFETLMLANKVASTIESKRFGETKFLAFYQPYQVPEEFFSTHSEIRERISTLEYAFDVSSEYDALGKGVYTDHVHVNQTAKRVMGTKIADIVAKTIQQYEIDSFR